LFTDSNVGKDTYQKYRYVENFFGCMHFGALELFAVKAVLTKLMAMHDTRQDILASPKAIFPTPFLKIT